MFDHVPQIECVADEPGSSIGLYSRSFRTLLPFQISPIARTCSRHLLCTQGTSTHIYTISPVLRTLISTFAPLQQYFRTIFDVFYPNFEDFALLSKDFAQFSLFACLANFSVLRSLSTCSYDLRNSFRFIFDQFRILSPIQITCQHFAPLAQYVLPHSFDFTQFRFAHVVHASHLCSLLFYIHFNSFRTVVPRFNVRTSHTT
jgi:hypothetical protein